jgi:hypothetical protein
MAALLSTLTEVSYGFPQSLHANTDRVPSNKSQLPPSKTQPTQYSRTSSNFIQCHIISAFEIASLITLESTRFSHRQKKRLSYGLDREAWVNNTSLSETSLLWNASNFSSNWKEKLYNAVHQSQVHYIFYTENLQPFLLKYPQLLFYYV